MFLRKALLLCSVGCLVAWPGAAQSASIGGAGNGGGNGSLLAQAAGAATGAAAKTGGTKLHGVIADPDGDLIPGATITLTPAHGPAVKAASGSDGTYSVTVAPGTYTLRVSMQGFATYSVQGLKVPAVAGMTLDAKLQIGQQTQVVNVEANALTLSVDQDSNASSTVLTGKDLDALSDDPDELQSELTALAGPAAGPNGGQIYVDGFTGGELPPKSSIREIRINQNPFSAEYDKLGYGRIEVFTKPGTDRLHGSFQINGEPSQIDSKSPLIAPGVYQPPYHTVFMFGNLSGPLNQNASYSVGGSHRDIEDDAFTNVTLYAPTAGSVTPCAPGQAGCVMTQAQISTKTPQTRTDISPRIDLALGDKNVLTTRFQYVQNSKVNQGIGNFALPSSAYNATSSTTELQMSDTQTFSPKLINETRFEYERDRTAYTPQSTAPQVNVQGIFSYGGYSGQNTTDHEDHYEVQNYTSVQLKKNFLRLGGRLRVNREAEDAQGGTNGSFVYSSLASYAAGTPSQFSLTVLHAQKVDYTLADLGLYAETDWKPLNNLTISYGLRYETQNHLNDHHDIAPRTSFAWGLGSGKGSPKTVIRGGFGMFYDRFGQSQVLTLARQGQSANVETVYTVSGAALPAGCTPGAASLAASCTAGIAPTTQTTYSTAPNLRTPYIVEAAIGADQQVSRFGTISVNFLHSQGSHQLATQNVNYVSPTVDTGAAPLDYQYFSEGNFTQNQLIVNGRIQAKSWLSLFGYYSLNSAHGDTSGAGSFVSVPHNMAADYGRTSFDVRSRLFLAGSITLPKFIQVSPFMVAQSGNPYNVTTGQDINNDSIFNDRPVFAAPNGIPAGTAGTNTIRGCGSFAAPTPGTTYTPIPINDCTGPQQFSLSLRVTKTFGFGPSTAPPPTQGGSGGGPGGDHGHGGHHGGGPGFGHGGGSSTGKRYNLAIGVHIHNLFNNENLATPNGTLSSPQFGQSTQLAGGPYGSATALRQISMQLSFNF